MRIRPALPLSVQLLLIFVSLLAGMAVVLTRAADEELRNSLEREAGESIANATLTRQQALTKMFTQRQQRAEAFLVSMGPLCTDELNGRDVWIPECIQALLNDFIQGEDAVGIEVRYPDYRRRSRILSSRSGELIQAQAPETGTLTRITHRKNGEVLFVMHARHEALSAMVAYDYDEITRLFADYSTMGRGGELQLIDPAGLVLTPFTAESSSPEVAEWRAAKCRTEIEYTREPDARGIDSFLSFRPVPVLGGACVGAHLDVASVMAPAEGLWKTLLGKASWFVLVGAVLSLIAAQWIARPVRRLAEHARTLQSGKFDRPIPLAGPSEIRDLGRAFNAMGNDLAEMVAKEQSARREAEAANRAKDDFLAQVSHELRTPLTAILGWAHMLQSNRLPADRVRHAIAVIERAARAQRQLIEDLLDVSRIVSNRLQITREPLRFADIIEAAFDTVRPQAAEAQISIETDLASRAMVLGDAQRLEQIVWNLAWNAVKFTQPSGRITVKLTEADGNAVLSVADTGVGIASAFLPHIFEWFKQGEKGTRSQAGLGLGLGLVRHLVRLHGGSVTARSAGEGHGATFIVRLPLHVAAAATTSDTRRPAVSTSTAAAADRRLAAIRVLVVEDDDDTRELVRVALESAGAVVEAVSSARDARREIETDVPDVLISDIRMPEEDGYSLLRSLRTAGFSTPAIALTALARREDAEAARAAGFQVHVPKPVDSCGLVDAVASVLQPPTVH